MLMAQKQTFEKTNDGLMKWSELDFVFKHYVELKSGPKFDSSQSILQKLERKSRMP